jgi:hypothetical protein
MIMGINIVYDRVIVLLGLCWPSDFVGEIAARRVAPAWGTITTAKSTIAIRLTANTRGRRQEYNKQSSSHHSD